MCGVCGVINQDGKPVSAEEIKSINDLVTHRGPDDEGYFFGSNFALGHRRLSILDLSEAGHQPMHFQDKYVLIFNGEIYNYIELRDELEQSGYEFRTQTDTEVILAAYDSWGAECLHKFNGMWALALFDKTKSIIFCSRDRFGIKPFYYTVVDGKFVFGSEIKQLLEFYPRRFVNKPILIDYLVSGMLEHNNQTFFKNILKLGPSHNLIYDLDTNEFKINRYYTIRINAAFSEQTEKESVSLYTQELLRAVKIRLRSDVKVGTCLSGGLDSSSVATLASAMYKNDSNEKFNAITAKSTEKKFDETQFAELVVKDADLSWNITEPSIDDFKRIIDEVIYTQEEPFGSPSVFMQYFVMKKAREVGCTVLLDGQGGDETLLGYPKYYLAAYIEYFRKYGLFRTLQEIKDSKKNNTKMTLTRILRQTMRSIFPSRLKRKYARKFSFLKRNFLNDFNFLDELAQRYFDIHKLQIYEIESTNLPALLRYEDKNSMRHSVETRLPYIDYETLEMALSLNIKYKIKNGWTKYLLRKAMEDQMAPALVWRKNKIGFNAPRDTWLQALHTEMENAIAKSKILRFISDPDALMQEFGNLHPKRQWRLYNIAKWEEAFNIEIR
jgi:asparagine synthase (glutamine-hydrolysing)